MAEVPARARLALLACILSSSLVGMDGVMTPVALPAIASDLDAGLAVQQWVVAAFLLALGGLLLVGGALGDVVDRWRIFAIGTAGFSVASLMAALAPNAPALIAGRFLQGAAAALMVPGALSIITTTFGGAARSRAIATWTAWSGVSVIVGPAIGGLLVETLSWRAVYAVLVPLGAIVVVLIVRAAPQSRALRLPGAQIDRTGALLAVPIVAGPVFGLIQGPVMGWTHPLVLGGFVVGIAAVPTFIWWEQRAPRPLVPFVLFASRTFSVLNAATFLLYAAFIATGVYVVLFLQQTAGYSPAAAGLSSVIPMMVLFGLSKSFGGWADRSASPRLFIAGGALVITVSMAFLMSTNANAAFLTVVLPWGVLHGIGLALIVSPLTAGVLNSADEAHAGAASGINNAVARIGSLVGVAAIGVLISVQFSSSVQESLANADISSGARAAADDATSRPFVVDLDTDATPETDEQVVEDALTDASVAAFRAGVGVIAILTLTAAGLTFAGLSREARRFRAAAGPSCLYGAHEEQPTNTAASAP